jgi:PEP-CTERM motif-containing protein
MQRLCVRLVGTIALMGLSVQANVAGATPVTTTFTVTATTGPLAGAVASGSFSYDSSIIQPGAIDLQTGLLTALSFTWNGIAYDESTADDSGLRWDNSGTLNAFGIGTDCSPGFCTITFGTHDWSFNAVAFVYTLPGFRVFNGDITFVTPQGPGVPEPGTLVLFGSGIVAIGASFRRRFVRSIS